MKLDWEHAMTTILRLPAVKARCGLSTSQIYALMPRGEFPKPVSLGLRAVGWIEEEINAWIDARISQSRGRIAA